jgi:putative membrane protein
VIESRLWNPFDYRKQRLFQLLFMVEAVMKVSSLVVAFFVFMAPVWAQAPNQNSAKKGGSARADSSNQVSSSDTKFIQDALQSGRHEVEVARAAMTRASDAKVKSFAQRLINDHTAANAKLETIARNHQVLVPDQSNSTATDKSGRERTSVNQTGVDPKTNTPVGQSEDHLMTLKGADFDKEYARMEIRDHEEAIAKFEAAQKETKLSDLSNFISSTVPTLRSHLMEAKALPQK